MNMHATLGGAPDQEGAGPSIPPGERIYAIGDVHGRMDLLGDLIAAIREEVERWRGDAVRILLLGDIIDRGDDSAALVALCREFAERSAGFTLLKGNHEAMMVQAYRGSRAAMRVWLAAGGAATLYSWGVDPELIDAGDPARLLPAMRRRVDAATVAWLDHLPISFEAGDYFFVHAGVRPGIPLPKQRVEDMLWIKEEFTEDRSGHAKMIVHGHSEHEGAPERLPNRIGIDSGAYRTDVLTALAIDGRATWTLQTRGAQDRLVGERGAVPHRIQARLREDLEAILERAARASAVVRPVPPKRTVRASVSVAGGVMIAIVACVAMITLRPGGERSQPSPIRPADRMAGGERPVIEPKSPDAPDAVRPLVTASATPRVDDAAVEQPRSAATAVHASDIRSERRGRAPHAASPGPAFASAEPFVRKEPRRARVNGTSRARMRQEIETASPVETAATEVRPTPAMREEHEPAEQLAMAAPPSPRSDPHAIRREAVDLIRSLRRQ